MQQKPLSSVPRTVWVALALTLLLQLGWQLAQRSSPPQARPLPPPPSAAMARLASLGEPLALSKTMLLYLQSFEDQAGVSLPWRAFDYDRLAAWLDTAQMLDPRSRYALVAASEIYAAVDDPARARRMLQFVSASFAADPARRWPAMAQAALIAKHQLHDLPLALTLAHQLRLQATGPDVPAWVRQMEAFVLEDMDQFDSAQIVLGGLMASGQITDPHELAFMARRLEEMAAKKKIAIPGNGHLQ